MRLAEVLRGCPCGAGQGGPDEGKGGMPDREISDIAYDSRQVTDGALFVAVRGEHVDGHDFIGHAVRNGAAAVVAERLPLLPEAAGKATLIRVEDSRAALACLANNFYRRPSEEVVLIGVTGTNGKTTTTYLLRSILMAAGRIVGLIGTIRYLAGDREFPAPHTTPEAPEFQGLLREMISAGCTHVVSEVSSHALVQRRVDCTNFSAAVFTNLTRDHLDFHGTMDAYFRAKKRLFTDLLAPDGLAVINTDDPWGRSLRETAPGKMITYGLEPGAEVTAADISTDFSGVSFFLAKNGERLVRIEAPLVGMTNVSNILAAAAACLGLGLPAGAIAAGLRAVRPIPGRLERIDAGQDFLCLVDYAHTPDALERLIMTAREVMCRGTGRGRVISVFGCGGNRDSGKRPVMGEIASRLSDLVILTSDNPRQEDPDRILHDIESGIIKKNYRTVPDRKEAIFTAMEEARRGDIVLIAGKGHEEYQEVGSVRLRFSDAATAREAIKHILERKSLQ